jgi:hypothetical protein
LGWILARVADRLQEIDGTMRAIGRYVVRFSQLAYWMRYLMSVRLAGDGDRTELAELAFAQAEAQRIADSFFAMPLRRPPN